MNASKRKGGKGGFRGEANVINLGWPKEQSSRGRLKRVSRKKINRQNNKRDLLVRLFVEELVFDGVVGAQV